MSEYEPWDADKATHLARTATSVATSHGGHGDKIARENCGACAVRHCTTTKAPNYAGWLRVWIQMGWAVPQRHYDTEVAYAKAENPRYHDAIMRDIATWGIKMTD